jgi:hypothetical protein
MPDMLAASASRAFEPLIRDDALYGIRDAEDRRAAMLLIRSLQWSRVNGIRVLRSFR